jgi:hypothetical protein
LTVAERIEITGGAGPEMTAAIAAVVALIENEDRTAASVRPKPIHQSQWIRAGQSAKHVAPKDPKPGDVDQSPLHRGRSAEPG